MDSKKRTLRRLGIAGVATVTATIGLPALASAATFNSTPAATATVGAPAAPTGVSATGTASTADGTAPNDGAITLKWNAVAGAAGYNVYESTTAGAESGPLNGATLISGTSTTFTGLATGTTYYYVVTAVNAAGESVPSSEVSATPQVTAPAAPTNVKATGGYQSATVNFTVPSDGGSAITSFTVTPSINGVPQSALAVNATAAAGTATDPTPGASDSIGVPGLSDGTTYTFVVSATNTPSGAGSNSAASNAVTPAVGVPSAPASFKATNAGTTTIDLSWTAPATDGGSSLLGYNVYEGTKASGESTTPVNGASLIPASALSYQVNQLTPGMTYYFTIVAVNAKGSSAPATEASAATTAVGTAPAAPTNVSATPGYTTATVSWTVPANNGTAITGFEILPTTGGTAGTPVKVSLGGTVSATPGATDTYTLPAGTLTDGSVYTFQVAATNGTLGNYSAASNSVVPNPTAPSAPQALTVTSPVTGTGSSNTTLDLSWTAPVNPGSSTSPTYDVLEKAPGATTYSAAPTGSGLTSPSYSATGLTTNGTYSFEVEAVNSAGTSAPVTGSGTVASLTPGAPTALMATADTSGGGITLNWTPPVYQGDTSGTLTYTVLENGQTLKTGLTSPTTDVTGLTNGTSYTFSVEAVNSTGPSTSVNNPSVTATPVGVPDTPTVTATVLGPTSVNVSWTAPAANGSPISGYTVTSTDAATNSAGPGCSTTTATSCTLTGLTTDAYSFSVVATNSAGNSTAGTATATPTAVAPSAPTKLTVASNSGNTLKLTWNAPANDGGSPVIGYKVYAKGSPIGITSSSNEINGSVLVTGTSAIVDTAELFPNIPLSLTASEDFAVVAVNAAGSSPASNVASSTVSNLTTTPGRPGTPVATAEAGGKALVVWSPPANDGGATVTGYLVTAHLVGGKGKTIHVTGTTAMMAGLSTGRYYFTVVAQNAKGNGAPSSPSNFIQETASATPNVKVYVTPPAMLKSAGVTIIRVTTNKPGVQVHLFDEAFGTKRFFQKKIMTTTAQSNGTGVAIFKIGIARTNKFFVVADGVKSNTVVARVK